MIGGLLGAGFGYIFMFVHTTILSGIIAILPLIAMQFLLVFQDNHHSQATMDIITLQSSSLLSTLVHPFKHLNFALLFVANFISNLGVAAAQTYFLYFIQELIHPHGYYPFDSFIRTAEQAQALLLCALFVGALTSAYLAGVIADRWMITRKWMLIASCVCMGICILLLLVFRRFGIGLICVFGEGLCLGANMSCSFALLCDVLPEQASAAKDLAIYNIARNIPIIFASPMGAAAVALGMY